MIRQWRWEASTAGGQLTFKTTTNVSTHRRKKTKRVVSTHIEEDQADLVIGDTGDQTNGEEVKKPKKKSFMMRYIYNAS